VLTITTLWLMGGKSGGVEARASVASASSRHPVSAARLPKLTGRIVGFIVGGLTLNRDRCWRRRRRGDSWNRRLLLEKRSDFVVPFHPDDALNKGSDIGNRVIHCEFYDYFASGPFRPPC
jgi:hypothetical protein